jgi:hypothetical protein
MRLETRKKEAMKQKSAIAGGFEKMAKLLYRKA